MSYDRVKITDSINVTFKIGALKDTAIVTCPITGIIGTLNMPGVPLSFSYSHPLSAIANVRTLIKECKNRNLELRHVIERQTLAGVCLSLLSYNKLLRSEPTITVTEKNLFLQGCGNALLEKSIKFLNYLSHTPYIEDHKKGSQPLPLFSFSWGATVTVNGFAESFLQYNKTLRDRTDPSSIEYDRIGNISMDFIKERKPSETIDPLRRLRVIRDLKMEKKSFRELKDQAKDIYEDLEPLLSRELQAMCKLVIRNLHLGMSEEHATMLSSKLFLLQLEDADKLARIFKSSISIHLAEAFSNFSDEMSPKPQRTIAEILADKKAKEANMVLIEVTPRTPEEIKALEERGKDSEEPVEPDEEEEFNLEKSKIDPDEEIEEDLFDKVVRPSNPRSFKGEI